MVQKGTKARALQRAEIDGMDGAMVAASNPHEPSDQTVGLLYRYLESIALDARGLNGRAGVLSVRARDLNGVPKEPVCADIILDPTAGEEHFSAVADRIATAAQEEAFGLGQGTWPFVVYCKHDGENTPFSRRSFTVHVDQAPGGDLGPAEDGTNRSLLAQNQRHVEAQMRINVQALSYVVSQTNALLQFAVQRNEEYERTHADALALFRQGLEDKETREANREERARHAERIDKALSMLSEQVLPIAMGAVGAWLQKNGHLPAMDDTPPAAPESAP
jgi:hypothetical protein